MQPSFPHLSSGSVQKQRDCERRGGQTSSPLRTSEKDALERLLIFLPNQRLRFPVLLSQCATRLGSRQAGYFSYRPAPFTAVFGRRHRYQAPAASRAWSTVMVSGSCSSQSHCVLAASCDQKTSFPSDPLCCFPCSTGEAEPSISWRHNECKHTWIIIFFLVCKTLLFPPHCGVSNNKTFRAGL